ncbi:MAG: AAA domain-containing protein [Desulfomonilaceae bacterium]|nr:AAA domain-containing protein [Desulfomonilaceae bacterium]
MLPGETRECVHGRVVRIAAEPTKAPRGGYLFRGLEIAEEKDKHRTFIMVPEFAGPALYEFPLLCRHAATICGHFLDLNNALDDGTLIYTATPESELLLEPHRPVSVTDAVEAGECLRSVDVRFRTGTGEPFWQAKGRLIHELFDRLVHHGCGDDVRFDEAYQTALPSLKEILPGSAVSVDDRDLEREAEGHFRNLAEWLSDNGKCFAGADVEIDRISSRWGLKGRADAIFRRRDESLILELKSGRVPVDAHRRQLYAYGLLFSEAGEHIADGRVMYSANGRVDSCAGMPAGDLKARILSGRNRVVALKHSYTSDEDFYQRFGGLPPCSRQGTCFNRKNCHRLFGGPAGSPPAPGGEEREYYDRWIRLVSTDIWASEGEFSRVLDCSTLQSRIDAGRTISLAELTMDMDSHTERSCGLAFAVGILADPQGASDVAPGEELIVHQGDPCAPEAFRAWVTRIHEDRIFVRFRVPVPMSEREESSDREIPEPRDGWFLDRLPFSRPREAARQSLFEFLTRAHKSVVSLVVRGAPEDTLSRSCPRGNTSDKAHTNGSSDLDDLCFSEGLIAELNEDQESAVRAALASETFHLIHGPPGTGKTRVLARLIRLCLDRGERVLVACPTNVALDGLLLSVMDLGVREFLRVGRRSTVSRAFLDALERIGSPPTLLRDLAAVDMGISEFRRRVTGTRLVGATAYQCATHPFFLRQKFDRVIVDEAGQLDEPATLAPLTCAPRFVLGGDHLQLPPIVQTRGPAPEPGDGPGLEQSLFERLLSTVPDEGISRLKMQYRMNREVQDIPSRLFYDGALYPSPDAGNRRLCIEPGVSSDPEVNEIVDPRSPVVFVDVEGPNGGQARPEEAEVAGRIIESLVAGGVPADEVGVITPYRAQQALIRRRLSQGNGLPCLSVDTVDRFQGGEREVIILSLSRSDGVTSFLADRKRLNVSLSRARSKLILLGHGPVLEGHRLFAAVLEGVKRVRMCPKC